MHYDAFGIRRSRMAYPDALALWQGMAWTRYTLDRLEGSRDGVYKMMMILWRCWVCGWRGYKGKPAKCEHCDASRLSIMPEVSFGAW